MSREGGQPGDGWASHGAVGVGGDRRSGAGWVELCGVRFLIALTVVGVGVAPPPGCGHVGGPKRRSSDM